MKKSRFLVILIALCLFWALLVPAMTADGQENASILDGEEPAAAGTPANYAAGGEQFPPPEITAYSALLILSRKLGPSPFRSPRKKSIPSRRIASADAWSPRVM